MTKTVVFAVVGAVLVGVGVGVAWYLGPIAPIATGYAAKTTCSGHLIADRDPDDAAADLPDNPLVPFLRTSVEDDRVSTSLLGAWRSTAYATAHGCVLAEEDPGFGPWEPQEPLDAATPWPMGEGPPVAPDDVDTTVLEAAVALAFTEDDPDGRARNTRAVVVAHRGELIAERYGAGFDADTRLLGWSMGKSVASALAGRAAHLGTLQTTDDDLRPELWGSDDPRAAITVEQLLAMTDGLAFEEVYDPDTDATRMLFLPGDTGRYAAQLPLDHEPGTTWDYSSGTTNILCDVVQDALAAGPELAEELLFEPLGMRSAVLEADASGGLVCSSFAYATARDWARFGQLYLDDGVWREQRLLPEGWVEASTTPIEQASEATPYGWQWWLNASPDGQLRMADVPADAYWASGNEGQQVVVIPSEELVVIRLGFSGSFSGVDWGLEPMLAGIIDALP
ncbi:MAG: serine hydrolase [Nitriliruptoraceae bacterium]|nr:serine hydrolase [Nitriliruptoraceae bacterium]